jgi:hypothetical protein
MCLDKTLSYAMISFKYQSSRKPTCPKTEASEFEVGPVKIENQEIRLVFGFYQAFYDIL